MSPFASLPMQAKEIPESEFGDVFKVSFHGYNLRASSFREANLIGANFRQANLRSADFRYCAAKYANFNAALLKAAIYLQPATVYT